jgi:hypothetical protein
LKPKAQESGRSPIKSPIFVYGDFRQLTSVIWPEMMKLAKRSLEQNLLTEIRGTLSVSHVVYGLRLVDQPSPPGLAPFNLNQTRLTCGYGEGLTYIPQIFLSPSNFSYQSIRAVDGQPNLRVGVLAGGECFASSIAMGCDSPRTPRPRSAGRLARTPARRAPI